MYVYVCVCVRECVHAGMVDVLRRVQGFAESVPQQLLKVIQRTLSMARGECQESEGGVSSVCSLTPRRGGEQEEDAKQD